MTVVCILKSSISFASPSARRSLPLRSHREHVHRNAKTTVLFSEHFELIPRIGSRRGLWVRPNHPSTRNGIIESIGERASHWDRVQRSKKMAMGRRRDCDSLQSRKLLHAVQEGVLVTLGS